MGRLAKWRLVVIVVVLSAVLACTLSSLGRALSHDHAVSRGGGGGGELESTLKRRLDGRAAVVIVRVEEEDDDSEKDGAKERRHRPTRYLVQRKSSDYPVVPFRDAVCLIGGNALPGDGAPLETLRRELAEELPADLARAILLSKLGDQDGEGGSGRGPRLVGMSTNFHTAELVGKPEPYSFLCACYEVRISARSVPLDAVVDSNEGSFALLTREELLKEEKYAWGYDAVMSMYLGEDVAHFCDGATVTRVGDDRLKDWSPSV